MRYLGIDYGSKRLGIAISDLTHSMAFPLAVLDNDDSLFDKIKAICKEKEITDVVVGESKDFSQKENEIMKQVHPFLEKIKTEIGVDVHLYPELLTSIEAQHLQGSNDMNDASAAAIILTSFLNKQK
ncbi:MAG: Holliday junction resolvase RuvX [Patescibacteria group bacterium]